MPWTEQAPGRWQRPLGENERLIKWIGDRGHVIDREHWSVTIVGTFDISGLPEASPSSPLVAELARTAWILLRFRHPSIACVASADDSVLEYTVPGGKAALDQWADETFSVVPESEFPTAGDLVASLSPCPCSTAFFLPHTGQVVLHTAHWRTDGFGALHLLNAYFAAVADAAASPEDHLPGFGEEPARLTLAIEEALNLPKEPTPGITAAVAEAMATVALVPGSIGLTLGDALSPTPTAAGGTRFLRSTLSAQTTSLILAACRARGVGWLAAVHASLAATNFAASRQGQGHETQAQAGHYTSTMRFGLRPYLAPHLGGPESAAALYTGGYFAKAEAASSWIGNALLYDGLYNKGLSREFLDARREYAVLALQAFQRAAAAGVRPTRSEIDISSADDASRIVQQLHLRSRAGNVQPGDVTVEVTDLYLGVECLQRESYLFVWLFRDRLEFSLAYNEAFYERSYMGANLAMVASVLLAELHVDGGVENE